MGRARRQSGGHQRACLLALAGRIPLGCDAVVRRGSRFHRPRNRHIARRHCPTTSSSIPRGSTSAAIISTKRGRRSATSCSSTADRKRASPSKSSRFTRHWLTAPFVPQPSPPRPVKPFGSTSPPASNHRNGRRPAATAANSIIWTNQPPATPSCDARPTASQLSFTCELFPRRRLAGLKAKRQMASRAALQLRQRREASSHRSRHFERGESCRDSTGSLG